MAFHDKHDESIARDCIFIYLYGDIVDHTNYAIFMPPGVPDDVLELAIKDAWYNQLRWNKPAGTPSPSVGRPADLRHPLPQNQGDGNAKDGEDVPPPAAGSGWNPQLSKEFVDHIPNHLPKDATVTWFATASIPEVQPQPQHWPWPPAEEYEVPNPEMAPEQPKLSSIHLNRWYKNHGVSRRFVGWYGDPNNKTWVLLEVLPVAGGKP
jgi:hypothetical protein